MNKNIEKIDRYLKGAALPEYVSEQHRRQLRRQILNRMERKQIMFVRIRAWKIAAVIALICTGLAAATVVGVKIYKYHYFDKDEEGRHRVLREDGRSMWVFSNKTADNPELAVQTAEEMDLLKQQGIKELVSVHEIEVNGRLGRRRLGYKYTLSDGRTIRQYEDDPDTQDRESSLTQAQEDEIINLLRADEYVTIGFEEKEVRGRTFSFERNRFVLSDGTEVIKSIGKPSEERQDTIRTVVRDPKEAEQILKEKREIANLRQQDKRKLIGIKELKANDELDLRVFVYQYKLSDGRTRDIGEGGELNHILNKEQRQEWRQLKKAGPGEDLGTYEQTVKGRIFSFKRERYFLSDGTEIIWSVGTPKQDQ